MRKCTGIAVAPVVAAFLGTLTAGISPASAAVTDETVSGTVYDNNWSHYTRKRCATSTVRLTVNTAPDDDNMYHYASSSSGGGGSYGTKRVDEFTSDNVSLGLSSGCFYMNSRQQEGTIEVDWEDNWFGELDY
ncbi:hypothetical protein SUDANB6_04065 [Streptomyces sp. enrichment culture]|uniref:hypothetical protein n=1 Tax=Streptomyces sp. enrichment culture TaxID=1795815 RepID=UPI003F56609D